MTCLCIAHDQTHTETRKKLLDIAARMHTDTVRRVYPYITDGQRDD